MRAAYGKGYCDALTEDDPGSALPRPRVPHPAPAGPIARARVTSSAAAGRGVDSTRGPEAESRAARDRPLGRGRAGRLPALHELRRRRDARAPAEPARAGTPARSSSAASSSARSRGDARGGGAALHAARLRREPRPCRSSTRAPCPISSGGPRRHAARARSTNGTFVAEPDSLVTKCPSKYAPAE